MNGLTDQLSIFTRVAKTNRIIALSMIFLGRDPLAADEVTMALLPNGEQATTFKPGVN